MAQAGDTLTLGCSIEQTMTAEDVHESRRTENADPWQITGPVVKAALEAKGRCLQAYRANPDLIEEHFGIERQISEGGYGRRQIFELVQNGADELLRAGKTGRIEVVLTPTCLYCANEGSAIDDSGVRAILGSHRSAKRGNEIGRFGLGFKSVLAVTDCPEFFSRSGSFRFDPGQTGREIREIRPNETRIPRLRLCYPLNPLTAAAEDDTLTELMSWATTVVRLPLNHGDNARLLPADVRNFPPEFLLFSGHVNRLVLDDRTSGSRRTVTAERSEDLTTLCVTSGPESISSVWRLFSTTYRISEAAKANAGELADRSTLPVVWAVPTTGTASRGSFWAFFPTEYATTLRGIVNAPWKTNADRQNLLNGDFNRELLQTASQLVVKHLPALGEPDDPGRYLDYLPGRGRESLQWADNELTELIWKNAAGSASVADLDGCMQKPTAIRMPSDISEALMRTWSAIPGVPRNWVHPSLLTRERRARVERLITESGGRTESIRAWLDAAVDGTPESSIATLRLADELREVQILDWRTACILLADDGTLVQPDPAKVFVPVESERAPLGTRFVHPQVLAADGAREILTSLGIGSLDAAARLEALLSESGADSREKWEQCWILVREMENSEAVPLLLRYLGRLRVFTLAGAMRPLGSVLLPGELVPGNDGEDFENTVDPVFHSRDLPVLSLIGDSARPIPTDAPSRGSVLRRFGAESERSFEAGLTSRQRMPAPEFLDFDSTRTLSPIDVLESLSPGGQVRYTHAALDHLAELPDWTFAHRSNRSYPPVPMPNPAIWMLRRNGQLQTSLGTSPVSVAVGPQLADHRLILPVARIGIAAASALGLPGSVEKLTAAHWIWAFDRASEGSADQRGALLGLACVMGAPRPDVLRFATRSGSSDVQLSDLVVATTHDEARLLSDQDIPFVLATSELSSALVEQWGCRSAADVVDLRPRPVGAAEPIRIVDRFPGLLPAGVSPEALLVVCDELYIDRRTPAGLESNECESLVHRGTLYVRSSITPEDLVATIDREHDLGLLPVEIEALVGSHQAEQARPIVAAIRAADSIEDKLLAAIGAEQLRKAVPASLFGLIDPSHSSGDIEIARLAHAVHGVDVLRIHARDMMRAGLVPPTQWAGRPAESRWVRDLGFPAEYAGFRSEGRDPLFEVPGPPNLPPLHQYQSEIVSRIMKMLADGYGRGFVSLPTGAGKTRVATSAVVQGIVEGLVTGPVLWVAETDELCEQAVRTWAETWRAQGTGSTLGISRLWAGNEVEPYTHPQVIVATIAKLATLFRESDYAWLSRPAVVIIDEGHRALSPQYTDLLRWLGMDGGKDRIPLFGLSATPFRGTSETETKRLAARFGNRRLDDLGDDPYGALQRMGVLARVEHKLLAGSQFQLTADELTSLRSTRLVPRSVEARVALDETRNRQIVESIRWLPPNTPALLFAASVPHSEMLAGLLSFLGISARSISSDTRPGSRRHYIDQFRKGEIRVLTNYGVLTEGFDAPSVGAVYVTRPTYSPNLYQQMIGRGLRGPLNGGKERCIIVNVEDNFLEYGESLAFHEFDYLWTER